jgi:hypothetical protein
LHPATPHPSHPPAPQISEINEAPVLLMLNPTITPGRRDLPLQLYETELHVADGRATFSFVRANFTVEVRRAARHFRWK